MTVADKGTRDFGLDNAKFLLIILVVLGHALELFPNSGPFTDVGWKFIYSFHMPAFAFVAGCLSTRYAKFSMGNLVLAARTLLIPYLIFQAAYSWADYALHPARQVGGDFIFFPYIHLWFLPALFMWRMVLGAAARSIWFLPPAIVAALGAGWIDIHPLLGAFARTITFLPFFLAGYYLRNHRLRLADWSWAWFAPLPLLVLTLIVFVFPDWRRLTYFGNVAYGGQAWLDFARRGIFFCLAAAMIPAVLRLVPHRETFFSRFGAASMGPYLLHFFLILLAGTPLVMLIVHEILPVPVPLRAYLVAGVLAGLSVLFALGSFDRLLAAILRPRGIALLMVLVLAPTACLALWGLGRYRMAREVVVSEARLQLPARGEKYMVRREAGFGNPGLVIRLARVRFADFVNLELSADRAYTVEFRRRDRFLASVVARTNPGAPDPFGGIAMPNFGKEAFLSPFAGPGATRRVVIPIPIAATQNGFDSIKVRAQTGGDSFYAAGLKFGGGRL